jgi:hypothetical protein
MRCPHCKWRWHPKRNREVQWCPHCKRDITEDKPKQAPRVEDVKILEGNRFTPGRMQKLVRLKLYKYIGVPRDLPTLTPVRRRQRDINFRLADKFFRSEMTGMEMADELKIRRQAFYQRIEKAFDLMVERGSFQLTQKGREKIAREKIEISAAARKIGRTPKLYASVVGGEV